MQVFAHRGFSACYPENTRTALSACKALPIKGVEFDVFQVGNEFIITHDRRLNRLFNIDKLTSELTANELLQLFGDDQQPIATLTWLIEQFADSKLHLNIELKEITDIQFFADILVKICQRVGLSLDRLLLSSFNHKYLQQLAKTLPQVKLGMLIASQPLHVSNLISDLKLYSIHLDINCLSQGLIQQIKSLNLKVLVFTVDHEEDIKWLVKQQVDGIFANQPVQAVKIINKFI